MKNSEFFFTEMRECSVDKSKAMNNKIITIATAACLICSSAFAQWKPAGDKMLTSWGESLTPTSAWQSYPRPQLQRNEWQNLNGLWSYSVTSQDATVGEVTFEGKILVPFAIESSLSGVCKSFLPTDKLWYRRTFEVPSSWKGRNVILHFGAVDYECEVLVNGKKVGSHKGGNNSFSFDITKYLKAKGENVLMVTVVDPTDTDTVLRGKQKLEPKGIWYTPVSGIWKTVWLEPVSKTSFGHVVPTTKLCGHADFDVELFGPVDGTELVSIKALDGDKIVASYEGPVSKAALDIPSPKLWTPDSPNLYKTTLELSRKGRILDKAESYLAVREIAMSPDECGHTRFMLNGESIFQYGPLDQGWWPDGLLTPPSEEAMLYDMLELKKMGFNMLRKHIKVEPELYYYYADSLGLMVWQDIPSGFESAKASEQHVGAYWDHDWDAPSEHVEQWKAEYKEMVDQLRFYPSITTWVVFNEGWGQFRTAEMVEYAESLRNGRIIDGVTGWTDRKVGDMYDIHNYPSTSFKLKKECDGRMSVLGEFGGLSLNIPEHTWTNIGGWGYRSEEESLGLLSSYSRLMYDLEAAIAQGLAGAVYTQTTDVETELNGFLTYDRKVCKLDEGTMNMLHSRLYKVKPAVSKTLVPRKAPGFRIKEIPVGKTARYCETFNYNGEPLEGLSLWLASNATIKVYLNGVEIFNGPSRLTRSYNHYNISDYIKLLRKGENRLDFSITNTQPKKPTIFDFAVTGY